MLNLTPKRQSMTTAIFPRRYSSDSVCSCSHYHTLGLFQ
jgi:hypothetical protein